MNASLSFKEKADSKGSEEDSFQGREGDYSFDKRPMTRSLTLVLYLKASAL